MISKKENANKVTRECVESREQIFEKIQKYQKDILSIRETCDKDIDEIEKKFANTVEPLMKDRNALINRIPQFWAKALLRHPILATVFEPGEKDVLKYIVAIELEDDPENPNYFKIHFVFGPNPFFENRVLTKQFAEEGSASTTIKWKSGQGFPKMSKHEVWPHDELGLELKGFFRWFSDPEEQFCDPIADILKCHIWYDPLEFFFNETWTMAKDEKNTHQVPVR